MLSKSFAVWLKHRGIQQLGISSAEVADGGRGIVAERDFTEGDLLLQVPKAALITGRTARSDAAFASALNSTGLKLTDFQVLASFLLYECDKGASSEWHPYLEELPQSYTSFLSWSAADIAGLQVPHSMESASAACTAVLDEWHAVRPLLLQLGLQQRWAGIAAWQWAAATLASRTMHVPFDTAGALMPFGDLHNYMPPPPPYVSDVEGVTDLNLGYGRPSGRGLYDAEAGEYRLFTEHAVHAGDQVYLCYGTYTNLELLEHYGFQLDSNPHDTALLPSAVLKQHLGSDAAAALKPAQAALHRSGVPTWHILQAMRLASVSSKDRRSLGHLAAAGQPITAVSERWAWQRLVSICSEVLDSLPTTVVEDAAQLISVPAEQECRRLAITWRMTYKQILQRGLCVAEQALRHLGGG